MDSKIDYRFKILYAIAIIMVTAGYCAGGGIALDFAGWFPYYELHLVLFVFSSGYFYKEKSECQIVKYILKKVKILILPLLVYNILYGILVLLLRKKGFQIGGEFSIENIFIAPIKHGHQFVYNMGGWFVIPLLMIEIFNICFRKIFSKFSEYFFFVMGIILGIIGNYLAYKGYNSSWWLVLVRMLHFMPFYYFGTLYRRKVEIIMKKIPTIILFSAIFLIKLILYFAYFRVITYIPSWCNDFREGAFIPIVVGFLGIIFWFKIANILEPSIGKNKYINLIANNTYSIMINQFAGFMFIKTVFAFIAKYSNHFSDFNFNLYKTDI